MKHILLVLLISVAAIGQTARLTSDVTIIPPRGAIFQPPQPFVAVRWETNSEPLLVRVTISSNVVAGWIWIHEGRLCTNYWPPLSTNIISVTTNDVPH